MTMLMSLGRATAQQGIVFSQDDGESTVSDTIGIFFRNNDVVVQNPRLDVFNV